MGIRYINTSSELGGDKWQLELDVVCDSCGKTGRLLSSFLSLLQIDCRISERPIDELVSKALKEQGWVFSDSVGSTLTSWLTCWYCSDPFGLKTIAANDEIRRALRNKERTVERPAREDWPTYFKGMARRAKSRSTCARAQIGGVAVTKDHRIVATAYNGAPAGETHCVDLAEPIVFANHDMHCEHCETNLVDQLKSLFDQVCDSLNLHDWRRAELYFVRWIRSLEITIYISGPREVCTNCAKVLYRAGIKDVVLDDLQEAA